MGHLGSRVSALLDGQLPPAEAEQAWAHVYACHVCRDRVEREGWIKAQLAGLSGGPGAVPDHLVGSLRSLTPGERYAADAGASGRELDGRSGHGRRAVAMVGGGAAGAAMLGVLALGLAPASTSDRRPPANISQPSSSSTPTPVPVAVTPSSTGSTTPSGATPSGSTTPSNRWRPIPVVAPQ